jgi:hypothetical protein
MSKPDDGDRKVVQMVRMNNADGGPLAEGGVPVSLREDFSDGDFSDAPPTITELRSDRSQLPGDWTPRDALVAMLRRIDRGEEEPTNLIVITSEHWEGDDGQPRIDQSYSLAGSGSLNEMIGMVERAKLQIIENVTSR